jgi:hypothetical protein
MSTPGRLLYVALHGTAMRYAVERRNLDESIEELRVIADGRNDILAQAAGITAGSWYAWPSTHIGHELIAAGMTRAAGQDLSTIYLRPGVIGRGLVIAIPAQCRHRRRTRSSERRHRRPSP